MSFGAGLYGFRTLPCIDQQNWWSDIYRTLQLFFVETNLPDGAKEELPLALQLGRFGALVTAVWAILIALFPQVRAFIARQIRGRSQSCALVLGYGPVGQAIAAGLAGRRHGIGYVTAVHAGITPDMAARAKRDRVLLIEGNPSDAQVLHLVQTRKAKRVYITGADDLIAIDRAVAVREHVGAADCDMRVVLGDAAIGNQIAEAASAGFLGAVGVRWYSMVDETARLLQAEARFDRTAVETGAKRVHLVIVGAGRQGEAIAVETLLTNWRKSLLPPRITFLDRDPSQIEARMRQRMPAWFEKPEGAALPENARAILEFRECTAELMNFDTDPCLKDLKAGVTGWVFSTGSDALNLRAGTLVHRAIFMGMIDPAPLHIRIPTGYAQEPDDLVAHPLSLAKTFGSIDRVVSLSPLLQEDPDEAPKRLHAAYAKASVEMGLVGGAQVETWEHLSKTKRESNRTLYRTIAIKIEDFGSDAGVGPGASVMADPQLANRLKRVDEMLDYGQIAPGPPNPAWAKAGAEVSGDDLEMFAQLRDAAITEHNRWINDRALAQFRPTAAPDPALRDDLRRYHDNMFDWYALSRGDVRRFDVVLLRALLGSGDSPSKTDGLPAIRRIRTRSIVVPIGLDGTVGRAEVYANGAPEGVDVTELRVYLSSARDPQEPQGLVEPVAQQVLAHLDAQKQVLPRRLTFVFDRPPGERMLMLANTLCEVLQDRFGARMAFDALWHWRAGAQTAIGVIGHRDLTGFGPKNRVCAKLRQTFVTAMIEDRAQRLVCGYAEGADQCAVAAWNSLGLPRPRLLFPYEEPDKAGAPVFLTDAPEHAGAAQRHAVAELRQVGQACLPPDGIGHERQAKGIIDSCDILIAVADMEREALPGGTVDTIRKAEKAGVEMRIIPPQD
ncbi:MAG: hypothetical protein AAF744_14605 [Pseudomonadota bacterium]